MSGKLNVITVIRLVETQPVLIKEFFTAESIKRSIFFLKIIIFFYFFICLKLIIVK